MSMRSRILSCLVWMVSTCVKEWSLRIPLSILCCWRFGFPVIILGMSQFTGPKLEWPPTTIIYFELGLMRLRDSFRRGSDVSSSGCGL